MKPLVSILIPCYNAAPWLADTLRSALAQTWPRIEVIVVDDGSTDDSLTVARQFAAPNVQILTQSNQGASTARNLALAEAQGDIIQYLDADDLLAPDKIAQQMSQLLAAPTTVASGAWGRFHHHPAETRFIPEPPWRDANPVDWLVQTWSGHWMMHPAAWLVPRGIATQAGPWDPQLSLNDDGEYFCRVVLASTGISFCPEARSYYRSGNSSSLSGRKSDAAWVSLWTSIQLNTQHLIVAENSPRTRLVCANVMQRFIYEVYPEVPHLRHQASQSITVLGGSTERPIGSPMFQKLAHVVGWRAAKHIQQLTRRYARTPASPSPTPSPLVPGASCP